MGVAKYMIEEPDVPGIRITLGDGEFGRLMKSGRGKALWSLGAMSNFSADFYELQVRSYYEAVDQSDFESVFLR